MRNDSIIWYTAWNNYDIAEPRIGFLTGQDYDWINLSGVPNYVTRALTISENPVCCYRIFKLHDHEKH